jgi:glycerol-3-phosphate acyltransferase PlsY
VSWIFISYLCGSIPLGLLIARAVTGKDVREVGSGNVGATNVRRAAGPAAAAATLLLDALKGFLPVLLAPRAPAWIPSACAVAAVVGHCFPIWLRFRGGKGVATGLGVSLAIAPWAAAAGGVVYLILILILKISSVGSLAGAAAALLVALLTADRRAFCALAAIAVLIFVRHAANLRRLLGGQES